MASGEGLPSLFRAAASLRLLCACSQMRADATSGALFIQSHCTCPCPLPPREGKGWKRLKPGSRVPWRQSCRKGQDRTGRQAAGREPFRRAPSCHHSFTHNLHEQYRSCRSLNVGGFFQRFPVRFEPSDMTFREPQELRRVRSPSPPPKRNPRNGAWC